MIQNLPKGAGSVQEGAVYRRGLGGAMVEIAEVQEIGRDRMGIPHVRFVTHLMRGNYAASAPEQRTLSVDAFSVRYKERVQPITGS